MTNTDLSINFNKETGHQVLQTGKQMNLYYTDEYVKWLENKALKQASGVEESASNCNIPQVNDMVCPYGHKYRRHWCLDCVHFDKCKVE